MNRRINASAVNMFLLNQTLRGHFHCFILRVGHMKPSGLETGGFLFYSILEKKSSEEDERRRRASCFLHLGFYRSDI